MNEGMEQVQGQDERGPVTFVNPLEQKTQKKTTDKNLIISWIIRGMAILTELLFFFPLCVVSCSAGDEYDKSVGGLQAVFGFELSYVEGKVEGIWWLIFLVFITAWILLMWVVKDAKVVKMLKSRKLFLCLGTGVASALNSVVLIAFMASAQSRIDEANIASNFGAVDIRFTFVFWLLLVIQILQCVASVVAVIWLIIAETETINNIGADFKKFFVQSNKKQEIT